MEMSTFENRNGINAQQISVKATLTIKKCPTEENVFQSEHKRITAALGALSLTIG